MVLGTLALVWEAWEIGGQIIFLVHAQAGGSKVFNLLVSVVWMWVPGQPMRRIIEVETYFFPFLFLFK